jgi:two-component system chemotaxis sensor kinase CheA
LNRVLDLKPKPSGAVNIVVLRAEDRHFGLIVDEVNDTEEIVVKPLGKQLKAVNVFAGATIMGDGRIALILDPVMIARRANVLSEHAQTGIEAVKSPQEADSEEDLESLLMVGCGNSLMAVEMSHVSRLEEIPVKSIERSGTQEVVQYRGAIMPLVRIAQLLYGQEHVASDDPSEVLQVVVFVSGRNIAGLVVDSILDVVEEKLEIEVRGARPGIFGSAVIQKRVVDVLDVPTLVRAANPIWFGEERAA